MSEKRVPPLRRNYKTTAQQRKDAVVEYHRRCADPDAVRMDVVNDIAARYGVGPSAVFSWIQRRRRREHGNTHEALLAVLERLTSMEARLATIEFQTRKMP
jgi:uncharacterized protein YjcR